MSYVTGDVLVVSETEAKIFDGANWLPLDCAINTVAMGDNDATSYIVVHTSKPPVTPTGTVHLPPHLAHLHGSVSVTDGLSQANPIDPRDLNQGGWSEGGGGTPDPGLADVAPRNPVDPMDQNASNGSAA